MAPVLGYWNLRGLVMPIKYCLEHAGIEYEDKKYSDGDEWFNKDKPGLGLDFPNVPYYIDGNVKLTQSLAILRYVAEKNGLAGSSAEEKAIADMVGSQVMDLRMNLAQLCYGTWSEENKKEFLNDKVPSHFKLHEKFLEGKDFILGKKVSYADFFLWESIDMLLYMEPSLLSKYPNLAKFHERVANLPKMKAYLASPKCIQFPLNGAMAKWGGKMEDIKTRFPNYKV